MKNVTSKKIALATKNGLTLEEMAQKYECTIGDLVKKISQICGNNDDKMKDILSNFKANEKLPRPKKLETPEPEPVVEAETEEKEVTIMEDTTLADYQQREDTLSRETMSLEKEFEELKAKKRPFLMELREMQDKLDELENALIKLHDNYDESANQADEISKKMTDISGEIRPKREELEMVRQAIDELQTVTLCVSADGTIEAPDKPETILDDSGYEDLKEELKREEEFPELRMREYATLARLIKIAERIDKISLICDSKEIESAFWTLRGSNSIN